MQETKYFDKKNKRPLNLNLDGCDLTDWGKLYGKAGFARHPKGFKIFLAPEKIAYSDEYAIRDPYDVEQYIESDFEKRRIELTIDLLQEAVSGSQGIPRILDLGCGKGYITNEMHHKLVLGEYTGLDYSITAIEYAHDHFSGIDFAVGDAYDCPYSKAYFDVVVCNNLWEHVPDPLRLLAEVKNLLKPGGHIIISTPSRYRTANLVRILLGRPVVFMSKHHVTEYTVGQVIEQLKYGGFQIRRVLSRPLLMDKLPVKLARSLFTMLISVVGSHHQLEKTVFYLAKKSTDSTDP